MPYYLYLISTEQQWSVTSVAQMWSFDDNLAISIKTEQRSPPVETMRSGWKAQEKVSLVLKYFNIILFLLFPMLKNLYDFMEHQM